MYTLYTRKNPEFMSCGTISFCFNLHVTWRNETHPIVRFNCDHQISLTRGGTWMHLIRRRFVLKMIESQPLIWGVITVEIKCIMMDTWTHLDRRMKIEMRTSSNASSSRAIWQDLDTSSLIK